MKIEERTLYSTKSAFLSKLSQVVAVDSHHIVLTTGDDAGNLYQKLPLAAKTDWSGYALTDDITRAPQHNPLPPAVP